MANTLDTFATLRDIVVDKFEIDPEKLTPEATLEEIGLDSLDTFDVIFSAEEAFDIKVPNDQVEIKTVQDIVTLIDKLRNEQAKP